MWNALWYCGILCDIFSVCVVFVLYACCKKINNRKTKNDVLYFSVCGTRSDILCYVYRIRNALWYFVIYIFRMMNALYLFVLYFSACGTRSGILWLYFYMCVTGSGILGHIFLGVERALVFLLDFYSCSTLSCILCFIIPRVERTLVFCGIYFPDFLIIFCCIIFTLISLIYFLFC